MNKCSFCYHSYNENGIMKCPFQLCKMTQDGILNIIYRVGTAFQGVPIVGTMKGMEKDND